VTCYNNGQDGAIDITVSGGTKKGDYNYYWTTITGNGIVPLNEDQTSLSAGTYMVQVKDANQCSITEDFTVLQPAPFNFSGSDTTHIISPDIRKGSIDLEVFGGNLPYASFAWTGPHGYTASTEDIGNLDSVGIYTVTLTDGRGCIADTAFTILDNLTMFAEISAKTDVVCFGDNNGSATVTVHNGTSPYSYKWDDEPTARASATRDNMAPGTYYVTVTDGALKQSLPTKAVISSPSAALTINLTSQDLRCASDNSGVINLTVAGGKLPYTYAWSNGYNGEDLVNVAAGDYTVTVTDLFGCTVQDGKTLTQPASLWINPVISGAILCHGDRSVDVTANVTGGLPSPVYPHYDFVWDDPGSQTTSTAYDLGAGTYHVTVTDSNQCSMTTAVIINEPDELSYTAAVTNPTCPGLSDGSIVITPVGGTGPGYEFAWDNNVFTRLNTSIPAGRYILTMNDANYCTIVDTFFLADPDPLEIVSVDITDVSCLGKSDGSITVNAQGGTGTIEYSSDNGQTFGTSNVLNSLTGGDYIVAIRDESNCASVTLPVSVAVLDTVKVIWRLTDVTCLGLANGSIAVDATGGSGIYEYSIDGGDSFSANDSTGALLAGEYIVLVTDDNDCLSEEFPVTLLALDTVEIVQVTETDLTCAGINDGSIAVVATGGTGTYEYSVDGGTSFVATSTVGSLAEGSYSVVVRDDEGCASESVAAVLTRPAVCGLVIYNAFSPNDDGINEVWNIGNAASFPNLDVKIFNIWGKEVFSSSGYAEPWDGTFNGNDLPAGTYYYVIDPGDGSDVLSGDVSIVK
ncbi:MAG: gliding motility-associated C-terminal domain-containing protein, partial [Bacteroidales bacterium]